MLMIIQKAVRLVDEGCAAAAAAAVAAAIIIIIILIVSTHSKELFDRYGSRPHLYTTVTDMDDDE